MNSLAIFGLGAIGAGGWIAINRPGRPGVVAAAVLVLLVAAGAGLAFVDCEHLFRYP